LIKNIEKTVFLEILVENEFSEYDCIFEDIQVDALIAIVT
jgi:hypothetical protein